MASASFEDMIFPLLRMEPDSLSGDAATNRGPTCKLYFVTYDCQGRGRQVGGKEKGGAPRDAPPCGFPKVAYFISPFSGAAGVAGVSPRGAAVPAWLSAHSLS